MMDDERAAALEKIVANSLRSLAEGLRFRPVRIKIGEERGRTGRITRVELDPSGKVHAFVAFGSPNGKRVYAMGRRRPYPLHQIELMRYETLPASEHGLAGRRHDEEPVGNR